MRVLGTLLLLTPEPVRPGGRYPSALALDDTSGHLFVLDDGLLSHAGTSAGGGGVFVLDVRGLR